MTITLKRDDILKVQDIKAEQIHIPEWGGDVYVRAMSANSRDELEDFVAASGKGGTVKQLRAKVASLTLCDEKGKLLFTENDVEKIGEKSATVLQRIFEIATRLSQVQEDSVKELTENLQANPTGDSPTD